MPAGYAKAGARTPYRFGQFLVEGLTDGIQPSGGGRRYRYAADAGSQQRLHVDADALRRLFVHTTKAKSFSLAIRGHKQDSPAFAVSCDTSRRMLPFYVTVRQASSDLPGYLQPIGLPSD